MELKRHRVAEAGIETPSIASRVEDALYMLLVKPTQGPRPVDRLTRALQRHPRNVGCEHLSAKASLLQDDGDRVRLFAGGAASAPDAEHMIGSTTLYHF
jgi:hypothetical protein